MARAMWKAVLRTGDEALPVKMYAAVEERRVPFRLLHAADFVRVTQQLVHPESGEVVPSSEVRKGFPVEPGVFVALSPSELEALSPPPSREITVTQFVPDDAIAPHWFDRPYYLGPDGLAPRYAALASALAGSERKGLASWVMRGHHYTGALYALDGCLCLSTLHSRDEVLDAPTGETRRAPVGDARERQLAEQLVDALQAELDLTQFHDQHRVRVLALIEAKARGQRVPKRTKAAKHATLGARLEAELRASVSRLQRPGLAKARSTPRDQERKRA